MRFCQTVLFLVSTLLHSAAYRAEHDVVWNSRSKEAYESPAEGSVAFNVRTPPKIEGLVKYPLLIALSGGFRATPSERYPFFQANPTRTRIWGYRSMSTYDAMRVVALMLDKYPIEPDRVYLTGSSAGGSGAMHLASCYPDQFAAVLPLVAAGNNYPLANFKNLPVAFHHGDRDWTSAICNARVQAMRMRELNCPVILNEYAGAGHSIPGSHDTLMDWLFEQKRDPVPTSITHDCETPSLGRSYWFRILEFDDPHKLASVEATIEDTTIRVRPSNVAAFSLALEQLPSIDQVQIGTARLARAARYRFEGGRWRVGKEPTESPVRRYEAGGAANLYQGEPLLIVYGSQGKRAGQLRTAAKKLAAYGGPDFATLPRAFPVVADSELTNEQRASHNLILIGAPEENSVTRSSLPDLPIAIQSGQLVVEGREALPLENQVLSLLAVNLKHPRRLVFLLAPFTDDRGLTRFASAPQKFLAGSDGFDRVSQPDLLVQDTKHQVARKMQLNKDWEWVQRTGADKAMPAKFEKRSELAETYMRLMLSKSSAAFALWWGQTDKGMWGTDFNDLENYNPRFFTMADFLAPRRRYETTIGSVTGAELKTIYRRWGESDELQFYPAIEIDSLSDSRRYRLHMPMDMYIKLGQRKKNLREPQAGPAIGAADVVDAVFE